MSYEKFVMDLDHCGMIHRLLEGLTIDANGLGADAFVEAGPGRAFLDTAHTLANFETANYLSTLADTTSYEQWSSGGSLETQQRANLIWKQMLAEYEPPQIDPSWTLPCSTSWTGAGTTCPTDGTERPERRTRTMTEALSRTSAPGRPPPICGSDGTA